jgi:hypothetical protein
MVHIERISVAGITNIDNVSLSISDLCALVAPNNYGKSNVLFAIHFAVKFMECPAKRKRSMMNMRPLIPINIAMENHPFSFEIEGTTNWEGRTYSFVYGYSFEWARTKSDATDAHITEEYLRLKREDEPKYRHFIQRTHSESALYLASATGRCAKQLPLTGDLLAINKLNNYDDLFYIEVIRALNALDAKKVDTLEHPNKYFNTITPDEDVNGFSTAFPRQDKVGFFIYSLKEMETDRYELLRDSILALLPNLEDFEPVQVDLRKEEEKDGDVPFRLPEVFYDIRVKERYNNQYTSISRVSSGCQRILFILALAMAAELNQIPLLSFEELENSVHPRLLQNLLMAVHSLAGDTKILITSHSPYLIKYLSPSQIYLGLPTENGVADFRMIKPNKVSKVLRLASSEEVSLGEYLFEMMLDMEDDRTLLNEYFG